MAVWSQLRLGVVEQGKVKRDRLYLGRWDVTSGSTGQHRVAARQQLERLPRRPAQSSSSANSTSAGTGSTAASTATGGHSTAPLDSNPCQSTQNSQFLLSRQKSGL
ncbi:Protein of unknown function [Gryllus bimaculatus]|nr:Protein of unknown function [Gryllus bimaculatus]